MPARCTAIQARGPGAVLHESHLPRSLTLAHAVYRRLDLAGADSPAGTSGALLGGARLDCADLRGDDLTGADLRHTDLAGADVRGANFTVGRVEGCRFDGCIADGELRDVLAGTIRSEPAPGEGPSLFGWRPSTS